MEVSPWKRLPLDMQVMILLRLPVKSLVRFKCVSKNWLTEITSQSFIDLYNYTNYPQNHDFNHRNLIIVGSRSISSFDYSSGHGVVSNFALPLEFNTKLNYKIVGSCNGLLCFEDLTSRKILVYNPITKANRVMTISAFPETNTDYQMGFGYDYKHNDYKILWVSQENLAYILRMKNNTCEEIKFTRKAFEWEFEKSSMVYSNNALHWVGPVARGTGGSITSGTISGFDMESEQFYELRTPRVWSKRNAWNIADLGGYLHVVRHCCESRPFNFTEPRLEIWIMKEYGVQNSWTNLFKYKYVGNLFYRQSSCLRTQPNVYVYSKDDKKILVKFGPCPKDLFSYNLITRKIKEVGISVFDGIRLFDLFDRGSEGFYVAPWSPSFVSPY